MKKPNYPQEIIDKVIYNYVELKYGQRKSGIEFNIGDSAVKRILQDNHIPIRNIQEANISRYGINEDFFKTQSSEMAYILGFLASDGCVARDENCVYIELIETDAEILEKINKILENERPVKFYETSRGYKNAKIYFFSKKMKDDLAEYGIIPNKTYSKDFGFPIKLNKEYWKDYIRGYFDGDGCVKKTGYSLTFQIDSVNRKLLEIMRDFFEEKDIKTEITSQGPERTISLFRLYSYGENAKRIFEILYSDTTLYLKRKKDKYDLLVMK